jgi:predicted TIM-barrel fold metal-dependent hydrolase
MVGIVSDYFSRVSKTEQQQVFGGNAIEFYNIKSEY